MFVRPADADELEAVVGAATACEVEILVVGLGSNLLVSDGGFTGLAIQLGVGFQSIGVSGEMVTAGGATSLPVLARRTVADGLTGFEWAVGVPGSLGGAVRMNAGGHGSDMASVLEEATTINLLTGVRRVRPVDSLALDYRTSDVGPADLVTSAVLRLEDATGGAGEEMLAGIVRWRRENQPGGRNAGSVFTNPPGDSAGRLIDAAGLRGHRYGSAVVSERHANFIQVDDGGSADDVGGLMDEVVRRVLDVHGIRLHAETVMVGFRR
jgi:UDP-N-acetylmuramate dehydrogenase